MPCVARLPNVLGQRRYCGSLKCNPNFSMKRLLTLLVVITATLVANAATIRGRVVCDGKGVEGVVFDSLLRWSHCVAGLKITQPLRGNDGIASNH